MRIARQKAAKVLCLMLVIALALSVVTQVVDVRANNDRLPDFTTDIQIMDEAFATIDLSELPLGEPGFDARDICFTLSEYFLDDDMLYDTLIDPPISVPMELLTEEELALFEEGRALSSEELPPDRGQRHIPGQPTLENSELRNIEPTPGPFDFDVHGQEQGALSATRVARTRFFGGGHTGGSVPPNRDTTTPGMFYLPGHGNLVRANHRFSGWRDWNNVIWAAGAPAVWHTACDGEWHLTADWIPNTQAAATVRFFGGGHTGGTVPAAMPVNTSSPPRTIILPGPGTMTRAGYTFGGWRDWNQVIWPAGERATWTTACTANWDLTAHWVRQSGGGGSLLVRFNGNRHTSGLAPANMAISTPGNIVLPGRNTLVRTGFTFDGWRDSGGTPRRAGTTVTWTTVVNGAVDFNARWNVTNRPTISRPTSNQQVPNNQGLVVQWTAVNIPSVRYTISMRNLNTNDIVLTERTVTGTNFTIPVNLLTPGHRFRVAVSAEGVGSERDERSWSEVEFTVQPLPAPTTGVNVTVLNATGLPVRDAVVQLVQRDAANVISHRTDANGIVRFTNVGAGTFGINVTHRFHPSTADTSRQITRTSVNNLNNVSITMPTGGITALSWHPLLADMGTVANPTFRISSVYGWRSFRTASGNWVWEQHNGVDIVARSGSSAGRRVNSPLAAEVVGVYINSPSAGNGIVLRTWDPITRTHFYVRHLHLQNRPARANDTLLHVNNTVSAGEQVGRLGATGAVTGAHLHTDVHRNFNPTNGGSFAHSVDPRSFYAEGFVAPWPDLNIR